MVHTYAITVAATALLSAFPVNAGLYSKGSPVIQIDGKNYDRLIAQSNYTSIVEFYAPWCGHCKSLQPAYEKAAKSLVGLAKVAAVDCDEESNKAFCDGFGVKGFPTLKIVKPGSKPGSPIVEEYQGPRTAKGIVDAVIDKIPNHVKRVDDKTLETFLAEANDTSKAILFTDKGKTSALMKAIAIDFKGSIKVAQIRNTDKEKASLELFGVSQFPTLMLLPGGPKAEAIVYDGEMKKEAMVTFLSQAATPNPDPAPAKVKLPKNKDSKKASKAKQPASSSKPSTEEPAAGGSATAEENEEEPSESTEPEVKAEKPAPPPEPAPPIPILFTEKEMRDECLGSRTGTCILALLPNAPDDTTATVVGSLSELAHKHKLHRRKLFPFYAVAPGNTGIEPLRQALDLNDGTEVIAVNGRRGWWRSLPHQESYLAMNEVSEDAVQNWVDTIRLGEGAKKQLPEGLVSEEEPAAEQAEQPIAEEPVTEDATPGETKAEPTVHVHNEL